MNSNKTTPLSDLILKAIEMGASGLEIEYKYGYEEICAMSDNLGFGIGRLESSSEEAILLREELFTIHKNKKTTFRVNSKKYVVRVKIFDSFGEDAFYVTIGES
ncbi:MAG: hypothetical protein GY759_23720 [Chloroflexi bacterium]|nr:hypothetical protein [Chloroflexota bacterium]